MQHKPVISIMLDTRKALASGLYPIKLRATFQTESEKDKKWERKYYTTECAASEADFATIMKGNPRTAEHKRIRGKLIEMESKAKEICDKNSYVNPDLFDRLFSGPGLKLLGGLFDRVIIELEKAGDIGNMKTYKTAKNSLIEFEGDLPIGMITQDWLKRYEKWMVTSHEVLNPKGERVTIKPRSITTIAMYLRCLRKIFNDAIEFRIVSADQYPFGHRRYKIQEVKNPKQALTEKQKDALISYVHQDEKVNRGVAFWTLSYFCNGMNMNDILRLRIRDIQNGMVIFNRYKTIRTSKVLKKIIIIMREEVAVIIARYGNKSLNPGDYVFPVLSDDLTPQQEKDRIQSFVKLINEGLHVAAKDLEFNFNLTTYTARHTFTNILLLKGASKEYLQEALGHESITTTESYTAGFDIETKKKMSRML